MILQRTHESYSNSRIFNFFFWLVAASFLAPLVHFSGFYFPYVISKNLLFYLVIELALPFYVYLVWRQYGWTHFRNPIVYAFSAYLGVNIISALFGVNVLRSFWGNTERMGGIFFLLHLGLWLIYLLFIFQVNREKISTYFNIAIGIGCLSAIYGIMQAVHIVPLREEDVGRTTSFMGNAIMFAAFLVIPLALSLFQAQKFPDKKFWYWFAASLIMVGIITTRTAGVFVGLIGGVGVGIIVYVALQKSKRTLLVTLGCLVITAVVGVWVLSHSQSLKKKFVGNDAQSRLIEWQTGLKGLWQHPILGVGPENYYYIANKNLDDRIYAFTNGFFDKPHNYFLEVAANTGLLGFIAYFLIIFWILAGLYKLLQYRQISPFGFVILVGGLTAYLIQNFFEFDSISSLIMFVLFIAFAAIAYQPQKTTEDKFKLPVSIGITSATILVLLGLFVNITTARDNMRLAKAVSLETSDPAQSAIYFNNLLATPFYIDQATIGINYEYFLTQTAADIGQGNSQLLGVLEQNLPRAVELNEKILTKNSTYLNNQLSLLRLYLLQSQLNGAIDPKVYELGQKIDEQYPTHIEADLILIVAYYDEGKIDQMQALMDKLNRLAPESATVQWQQANVYAFEQKPSLAVQKASEIMANTNKDVDFTGQLDRLAYFYENRKEFSVAVALYNQAIQSRSDNPYFYFQLARAYVLAGDKISAQHIIDRLKQVSESFYNQYQNQINQLLQ